MNATTPKILTYEDYRTLPEIRQRYEIIDGELIMTPAPTARHQAISMAVSFPLYTLVKSRDLGKVFYAPIDIVVTQDPVRTRQPDILFIRKERLDVVRDQIEGAPDLVIEILSPSNTRADMSAKLSDYSKLGVAECWIISPQALTVEVLVLDQKEYKRFGLYGLGDSIKSRVLPEFTLLVSEIFS